MSDIRQFLERHLTAVVDGDIETYHDTTVPDLTLYEWYVTPHRIDGLPFHDFMMEESSREESAAATLDPHPRPQAPGSAKQRLRFDLANYHEQRFKGAAICSYTLLLSKGNEEGVQVLSYNESRVLVETDDGWRVVHVHKSPAWSAPFQPPQST